VGFNASQFGPDPDARRFLHDSSHLFSVNHVLKQYQKMAREISGVDRTLRSFGGMDPVIRMSNDMNRVSSMARAAGGVRFEETNRMGLYADLAKRAIPESMRRGPLALARNLASVGYYPRLPSDVLMQHRMIGNLGLSSSVAQAFKLQGIASAYSSAWSLHRAPPVRTPALQSFLKTTTTFGPIVISPDDEAPPSNYHPDLQGWLIPETATESGDDIDVEELVNAVFAYTLGIAQHHRTRALLTVVGKHGGAFLIRVAENAVGGLVVYWLLSR